MDLKLKAAKNTLEASLSDPAIYSDKNKFIQAEADYNNALSALNTANAEFEEVFEKLMQLEENNWSIEMSSF